MRDVCKVHVDGQTFCREKPNQTCNNHTAHSIWFPGTAIGRVVEIAPSCECRVTPGPYTYAIVTVRGRKDPLKHGSQFEMGVIKQRKVRCNGATPNRAWPWRRFAPQNPQPHLTDSASNRKRGAPVRFVSICTFLRNTELLTVFKKYASFATFIFCKSSAICMGCVWWFCVCGHSGWGGV